VTVHFALRWISWPIELHNRCTKPARACPGRPTLAYYRIRKRLILHLPAIEWSPVTAECISLGHAEPQKKTASEKIFAAGNFSGSTRGVLLPRPKTGTPPLPVSARINQLRASRSSIFEGMQLTPLLLRQQSCTIGVSRQSSSSKISTRSSTQDDIDHRNSPIVLWCYQPRKTGLIRYAAGA